jgi:PAS domain S-box-containing protein
MEMPRQSSRRVSQLLMQYGVRPAAIAGVFVYAALLWTLLIQQGISYPFVFLFFGAVIGSAWFGGTLAGFLSVAFSTVVIAYFFVPPVFSMSVDKKSRSYLLAYVLCATAISWASSSRKRAEVKILRARDELEERVQERTAEIQSSHEEIVERERQLRVLTEAIPQQIWRATADGTIEYCNQHLLHYTGHIVDEMKGDSFFSIIHGDDRDAFRESWANAISSGIQFEGEWRVRGASGEYRWFLIRSIPQFSTSGLIARWYGTHIDIEKRHRTEHALAVAQVELSQQSRTLSMGELAASIAHELNQPITAVVTHAYACRQWLAADPPNLERASSTAEKIVQESTRASAVVAGVRGLFQGREPTRESEDINRLVRSLVQLLRDEAIQRDVIVRTRLDTNLPQTLCDPVQIQQVLLNLAMNGMDAMAEINGPRELLIASELRDSREIVIRVEDCGTGMSAESTASIFVPFFTTKPHGAGLGLSISRSIIEAHDGKLWSTPRLAGGTVFQFTIPVMS